MNEISGMLAHFCLTALTQMPAISYWCNAAALYLGLFKPLVGIPSSYLCVQYSVGSSRQREPSASERRDPHDCTPPGQDKHWQGGSISRVCTAYAVHAVRLDVRRPLVCGGLYYVIPLCRSNTFIISIEFGIPNCIRFFPENTYLPLSWRGRLL